MNYMAIEAEMAVRTCRWGEGLEGVRLEDREFIDVTEGSFYRRLENLTKEQVAERRRIMSASSPRRKHKGLAQRS